MWNERWAFLFEDRAPKVYFVEFRGTKKAALSLAHMSISLLVLVLALFAWTGAELIYSTPGVQVDYPLTITPRPQGMDGIWSSPLDLHELDGLSSTTDLQFDSPSSIDASIFVRVKEETDEELLFLLHIGNTLKDSELKIQLYRTDNHIPELIHEEQTPLTHEWMQGVKSMRTEGTTTLTSERMHTPHSAPSPTASKGEASSPCLIRTRLVFSNGQICVSVVPPAEEPPSRITAPSCASDASRTLGASFCVDADAPGTPRPGLLAEGPEAEQPLTPPRQGTAGESPAPPQGSLLQLLPAVHQDRMTVHESVSVILRQSAVLAYQYFSCKTTPAAGPMRLLCLAKRAVVWASLSAVSILTALGASSVGTNRTALPQPPTRSHAAAAPTRSVKSIGEFAALLACLMHDGESSCPNAHTLVAHATTGALGDQLPGGSFQLGLVLLPEDPARLVAWRVAQAKESPEFCAQKKGCAECIAAGCGWCPSQHTCKARNEACTYFAHDCSSHTLDWLFFSLPCLVFCVGVFIFLIQFPKIVHSFESRRRVATGLLAQSRGLHRGYGSLLNAHAPLHSPA
eukprot:gnl/Trimastix_PCT/2953.p1 GENE.gnl/Trimastix_PCT/2953~~gnl/Trimastix_PCT/2953.p1  ORF type:complete len:571 (+),score=90.36 gnl/Trimastix_PCT/2953:1206-2918(+)